MTKKVILLFVASACLASLARAADPFYSDLLQQGKQLFLAGNMDEALENFKIAEFGLLDDKAFIPELYYYYALAQYKKGMIGESKAFLEKMKTVMGTADIEKLAIPKEIESELSIMVRALKYLEQPGVKPGSLAFFNLFYETWDLLKLKKLANVETNLKRLEKMAGDDLRLPFLEGYLAFQKGDYKKCIKRLEKIVERLDEEFREDAAFYLSVSSLQREDLVAAEKHSQKIKNPAYVHQLMELMDELKAKQQAKQKKSIKNDSPIENQKK